MLDVSKYSLDYPKIVREHISELINLNKYSIIIEDNITLHNTLTFKGTLKYKYNKDVHKIYVKVNLYKSYPLVPPVVYIIKSSSYTISHEHPNVNEHGLNWKKSSNFVNLFDILIKTFRYESPVFYSDSYRENMSVSSNLSSSRLSSFRLSSIKLPSLSISSSRQSTLRPSSQPSIAPVDQCLKENFKFCSTMPIFENTANYLNMHLKAYNDEVTRLYNSDPEKINRHYALIEHWIPAFETLANIVTSHRKSNSFLTDLLGETNEKLTSLQATLNVLEVKHHELYRAYEVLSNIKKNVDGTPNYSNTFNATNPEWRMIISSLSVKLILQDQIDRVYMGLENKFIGTSQFVKYLIKIFSEYYLAVNECNKFINSYIKLI